MSLVDRNKQEVTFLRRLRTKLEDGEIDAGLVMITRRISSFLDFPTRPQDETKENTE